MPKIMKGFTDKEEIRPFDFFAGFQKEEPLETTEEEAATEEPLEAEDIGKDAREQAKRILQDAREQADILREEAFLEGKEKGREEGFQEAYEEQRRILNQEIGKVQRGIADLILAVSIEKDKLLERYIEDLKNVSLAVAEKVIHTSLESSGDIVKRMILAATDKMTKKQWAKIFITKFNTNIAMEADTEFLDALSHLSDNIKIVTMDNGEEGTCIIELPDEIVDASVGTQLENIKDILSNARV